MNRAKILILTLLISVALFGVVYAYWNQTVSITSTVSTGELKVEFLPVNSKYVELPYIEDGNTRIDYRNSRVTPYTLSNDNQTLSVEFGGVFPGMYYYIPFELENKGTMPVIFKNCKISRDITDSFLNGQNEASLLSELDSNLKISNLEFILYDSNDTVIKELPCVNGSPIPLGELESKINETLKSSSIRLEPGQHLKLSSSEGKEFSGYVRFQFGQGFSNAFEDKQFSVTINMEWTQFNAVE